MCNCNNVKLLKDSEYMSPPTASPDGHGYRHTMGYCSNSSDGGREAHQIPPTLYPRCEQGTGTSSLQDKIYRRCRTTQQDYGWSPDRQPGAGVHEGSIFDQPQMSRKECEKLQPPNHNHCNNCAQLPTYTGSCYASQPCATGYYCSTPTGGKFMPSMPSRSERGKTPSNHSAKLMGQSQGIDPRRETGDQGHPCCHETRPLLMYSPRTMATSYRGMHHNLGPDTWPKEIYHDPAFRGYHEA